MPQGGFGNLIALPLQRAARKQDNTAFLDGAFVPWPDQWAFLASIRKISRPQVEELVAEGFREVDMLRGRSHWKYRWTDRERRNWSFVVESPGLRGRRGFWADLSANPPGVVLKRLLPAWAFARLQHGIRALKASRAGGKGP